MLHAWRETACDELQLQSATNGQRMEGPEHETHTAVGNIQMAAANKGCHSCGANEGCIVSLGEFGISPAESICES